MKNLLKTLQLLAICLLLSAKALATTYYVKTTGSDAAAGTAWATAFQTLQKALSSTASGDQIWVAKGTYYPTTNPTDRSASFVMKAGVKIYGSFKGDEANLTDRTLAVMTANTSILSGDIDYATDPLLITGSGKTLSISGNDGNSFHVIFNDENGLTDSAVLDGFVITGGYAEGYGNSSGGGMYNSGSSPRLNNLTFSGNYSFKGGGIYNSNSAPQLSNCTFITNKVGYGGCIYNDNQSSPIIENCNFFDNYAGEDGGGIYNISSSAPTLSHCTFTNNYADVDGGGITNKSSSPSLTNCTFTNNLGSQGAGMYNQSSNPTLTNVIFSENFAIRQGGGMANRDASPILINVSFVANRVDRDNSNAISGGGMYNYDGSPSLSNCTFINNYAKNDGGGMYSNRSNTSLNNCTFTGNSASIGGGMFNVSTVCILINITFSKNSATQGGAMFNSFSVNGPATTTIKNGIFWGNTKSTSLVIAGADVENETDCSLTASHTAMQLLNNTTNYPSTGFPGIATSNNFFGVDPLFVNATAGNVRLVACSPAINVGNNAENSTTTDLDGNNRKVGIIDLGAYEYQANPFSQNAITLSFAPICLVGNPLNLSASGGEQYAWKGPNNFKSNSATPSKAKTVAKDEGIYSITVTGYSICTASSTIRVYYGVGKLTATSNSPVCKGGTIRLSASAEFGVSYTWTKQLGSGSYTGQNPAIPNAKTSDGGLYIVFAKGINGCIGKQEMLVTVSPVPCVVSRLASEEVEEIDMEINAYPNPVTNILMVEVTLQKPSKLSLSLFNSIGKESGTWQLNEESTFHKADLNMSELTGGVYLLQAQAGKQKVVKRVVKIQY